MTNTSVPTGGLRKVLPVLFGFFIMGFVDVVGTLTTYAKTEFGLSETLAGFIPSMIFIWFLVLGIPTAILMNRIGRKNTVQLSNLITIVGMIIPFISFNFVTCLIACGLLGVGNTLLQVSLNPMLANVVKGDRLSSSLTTGQVVKAVSAVCAPFIAAFAAGVFGSWEYIFPIYAGITVISALWLMATPIGEDAPDKATSLGAAFGLLRNRMVLLCFLGIIFIVGVDVGMNTVTPKLLIERAGFTDQAATFGISVYSICRTIGALIGAVLLVKLSDRVYYRTHILIAFIGAILLLFFRSEVSILVMVGVVGYACSSIFAVIFSQALKAAPDNANEISGLMITGVCGGAIIPPLMAVVTDTIGSQVGSVLVILVCVLYLCIFGLKVRPDK